MHRYLNWSESFLAMEEVKGSSPFRCSSLQDWQRSHAPPFQGGLRRCEFGILLHLENVPNASAQKYNGCKGSQATAEDSGVRTA